MDIFVGRYARFVGFRAIVMVKQSTQMEARMITLTMLSRETGVSRRVLQDYDRLGLLRHRAETPGGYWLYNDADAERLQLIQALRSAGYTRQEVARLLPDPAQPLEDALEQIETSLRERQSQLTLLLVQVRQMRARQQEG